MSPGGADGQRGDGKGKGSALPAGYVPPGGVRANAGSAQATGGTLPTRPASSASVEALEHDVASLKAEVESLRLRLTAQEETNKSLETVNDELASSLATLSDAVQDMEDTEPKSRRKTKDDYKRYSKGKEPSPNRNLPDGSATNRRDRARILRQELRQIENETKLACSAASRVENATDMDSETSSSPTGMSPSQSPSPSGPSGPSSPSSSDPGNVSYDTDSDTATHRPRLGTYQGRRKSKTQLKKADRLKVIRPSNSRFASLLDHRTYFRGRRDLAYPPSLQEKAHKMNRRLDGAFPGQELFTGAHPLGVFTFLTTLRRACDAAGLAHGQALPLLAFRLSSAAKKSSQARSISDRVTTSSPCAPTVTPSTGC